MNPTGIGSRWQYGLPPGVYEDKQQVNIKQDVRMDVAAFVGLTERGPVSCPVVVESWDEYISYFGRPGGGRLLADSVRLFFSNGGRRCVVTRVLDYENAATTLWSIPQIHPVASYLPLQLQARNPGSWGDQLQIQLSFQYEPMIVYLPNNPVNIKIAGKEQEVKPQQIIVADKNTTLYPGSTISFEIFDKNNNKTFVNRLIMNIDNVDLNAIGGEEQRLLTLDSMISHQELTIKDDKEYFQAQHLLINLTIKLEQKGSIPKHENWRGLALHPDHPRYFPRIINRKNASEIYIDDHHWSNNPGLEAIEESLLPELDTRAIGSELVRYPLDLEYLVFSPDVHLINENSDEIYLSKTSTISFRGNDSANSTTREHFFTAPKTIFQEVQRNKIINDGMFPFANQSTPLKALDSYDSRNEAEPISLINFPDLVHPKQYEKAPELPTEDAKKTTFFDVCESEPIIFHNINQIYPNLLINSNAAGLKLREAQQKIIEYCEIKQDRIGILDLPLGLPAGEIVNWKRSMQSSRAALYSPYLELNQDDINPLIVPPGGAVCGLIAKQENQSAIHIAPANLIVSTVLKLHDDQFLPDLGFLHQERINTIREEPDGLRLMGSRTTSRDSQWTHISVRRLVDYLERQLLIDTRWAVFEVHNHVLWNKLYDSVNARLRPLYEKNSFSGVTIEESYFIRCNELTNQQFTIDNGQVVILVGIAPSVPAEFIVFRLTQQSEGLAQVEELHG